MVLHRPVELAPITRRTPNSSRSISDTPSPVDVADFDSEVRACNYFIWPCEEKPTPRASTKSTRVCQFLCQFFPLFGSFAFPQAPTGAKGQLNLACKPFVWKAIHSTVTAEVASSSLVVPAISFQAVTRKDWFPRLVSNPNSNPRSILSRFLSIFSELDRIQIFALGFHLLAIHRVNVACSCLRFHMAKHCLNYRGMNPV
jgi:hypothetical protein